MSRTARARGLRVPPLARDEIDAEAAEMIRASFPRADKFFAETDAPPMPPVLGLLARHPDLAGPWLGFSGALLDGGVLDARTRELLIMATARRTGADYIWDEHLGMAGDAGLTEVEIGAISSGTTVGWSVADAALRHAVDELITGHQVGDETWAALAGAFDEQALLEILFVVGAYSCLAMVLNGAALTGDDGSA